jgi:uncharacterized SAM-binding protein YcdF (DUF218 family)
VVKALDLLRLLLAALVGVGLLTGYATFRIWQQGQLDERRPADAIVVLGAAQYDGSPSPVLRARLDHAIGLYFAGLAPNFVVTGGKARQDRTTEAAAARAYALGRGVPASAILIEDRGENTFQSVEAVGAILRQRGLGTALFVSDRTHMLRVLRMALDQGLDAWGSPTTTSPADATPSRRIDATIHELGGLAAYYVGARGPEPESVAGG